VAPSRGAQPARASRPVRPPSSAYPLPALTLPWGAPGTRGARTRSGHWGGAPAISALQWAACAQAAALRRGRGGVPGREQVPGNLGAAQRCAQERAALARAGGGALGLRACLGAAQGGACGGGVSRIAPAVRLGQAPLPRDDVREILGRIPGPSPSPTPPPGSAGGGPCEAWPMCRMPRSPAALSFAWAGTWKGRQSCDLARWKSTAVPILSGGYDQGLRTPSPAVWKPLVLTPSHTAVGEHSPHPGQGALPGGQRIIRQTASPAQGPPTARDSLFECRECQGSDARL